MRTRGLVGLGLVLLAIAGLARAATAQAPALTLAVTANELLFVPGDTLRLALTADNPGLPVTADFYVAVLLPDNATLVAFGPGAVPVFGSFASLAALPPVAAGVSLAAPFSQSLPDFLQRLWTGAEPVGLYRVFFAAVQAGALADGGLGAGELLALSTVDFLVTAPFTPTLEPGQAASALIAPAGGTLTATGTSGATYTLTVPPGALATATTLTLTPIASLANLPLSGLVAAVRAEPEGLEFLVPVTLTITVPGGLPAQGLVGFTARGDGAQFQLIPVQATGNTVSFSVMHFSVFGAGLSVPQDSLALTSASLSPRAAEFQAELQAPTGGPTRLEVILQLWFDEDVRPRLQQGTGADSALLTGLTEFTRWNHAFALGFPSLPGPTPPALRQSQTEGHGLAAQGFRAAIARANATCTAQRNLAFADAVLALQEFARNFFPPSVSPLVLTDLDRTTVLANLCVRVEIVSTSFPPPPYPTGQPQTLQVQARITFPGAAAPPLFTPIQIIVTGQGVAEAGASGSLTQGPTNSQGGFSTIVTPTGTGPVVLRITARINNFNFLRLRDVFAEALVGQLDVSPSSVTLAPGETQQFTATLNGQPHAVTWSVAGAVATITPGGLFEAFTPPSTQPVTVVVTATSTTNPNLTGTATVTIQGTGSASLFVPPGFGSAVASDDTNALNVCNDVDQLGAGAAFPAEVSAECPRSAARLTARLSGAGTLIFDGTARARAEVDILNNFASEADGRAELLVQASRDLHVTISLNSGWATLTGLQERCFVDMTASFSGEVAGEVVFRQRTGLPPEESDLTRTFTLFADEQITVFVQLNCGIVNQAGTAEAVGSGVVATVTFTPAP